MSDYQAKFLSICRVFSIVLLPVTSIIESSCSFITLKEYALPPKKPQPAPSDDVTASVKRRLSSSPKDESSFSKPSFLYIFSPCATADGSSERP